MRTRILIIIIFMLTCSIVLRAQAKKAQPKPDFTGTWLLDMKKSNSTDTKRPDLPLKITHQDPEFRLVLSSESDAKVVERELNYFTDGRGETNQATTALATNYSVRNADDLKNKTTKSTTKWSGNKIVTRSKLHVDLPMAAVEVEQIDEWKLSRDGKALTHTTHITPPDSSNAIVSPFLPLPDRKRVYNRSN